MKKSQNAKTVAKITSSEVILSNYGKLLLDIQKQIKQTGDLIIKTVTREKVVMAWSIGKMIIAKSLNVFHLSFMRFLALLEMTVRFPICFNFRNCLHKKITLKQAVMRNYQLIADFNF